MRVDFLRNALQGIVDAGNTAHRIIRQGGRRIGQMLFHCDDKLIAPPRLVQLYLHGESPVFARIQYLLGVCHRFAGGDQRLARRLALGVRRAHDGHSEGIVFDRMGPHDRQVLLQRLNEQLRLRDLLRIVFQRLVLHLVLLGGVLGLEHLQL